MWRQSLRKLLTWHLPAAPRILYWGHVALREGGIVLLRFLWWEPLLRARCVSIGPRFRMERLPYISGAGSITIGSDVELSGKSTFGFGRNLMQRLPRLTIGDHVFIGHNCSLLVADAITIGHYCYLAGGVRMADFDGHPIDWQDRRARTPYSEILPVTLGDDVWIGAGAIILKGVHIGDRSIVGAGSVVTNDVPPDTIVAGNPARVIRSLRVSSRSSVR